MFEPIKGAGFQSFTEAGIAKIHDKETQNILRNAVGYIFVRDYEKAGTPAHLVQIQYANGEIESKYLLMVGHPGSDGIYGWSSAFDGMDMIMLGHGYQIKEPLL